jgi:hypothetical protein
LPFLIRLRRPQVFDFIESNNLFAAVQDQVLDLVEFDQEQIADSPVIPSADQADHEQELLLAPTEGHTTERHGKSIALLVEHTYSIPVSVNFIDPGHRIVF